MSDGRIMINPKIVDHNGVVRKMSNCGSLTLEDPVQVKRYRWMRVEYFDTSGTPQIFAGFDPTMQHEIEHNLGVLIA